MNNKDVSYKKLMFSCLFLLIATFVLSIFIGKYSLNPIQTISKFLISNELSASEKMDLSVLFDIRLPKIIMSLLVGIGLSVCGTTYQAVLKNPLASPDILGTSSGAAFGAALAILLFPDSFILISIFSFSFGMLSIFMVFGINKIKRANDILALVLAGIIIRSLFMSLIALIKFLADTEETLPAITFWLMGSFSSVSKNQVLYLSPVLILCIFILYFLRWKLNIISLGDEEAVIQKINPKKLKFALLITSSIIVSISVTVSGMIAWVGLVIPHLARTIVGNNHGKLIPFSAITGGIFLLTIDNLSRSISYSEIPIGILTSLIGAPLFAILFIMGGEKN